MAGPGCGAQAGARVSQHPQRPQRRTWEPRACSRQVPVSSRCREVVPAAPPSCPAAPRDTAYLCHGARLAGVAAEARATQPPEGADARTPPARATEPAPGRCPAHAAGARAGASPVPHRCRRRSALRGAARTTTPTMPRAAGRAGPTRGRRASWDPDPQSGSALVVPWVTGNLTRAAHLGGFCYSGRDPLQ